MGLIIRLEDKIYSIINKQTLLLTVVEFFNILLLKIHFKSFTEGEGFDIKKV